MDKREHNDFVVKNTNEFLIQIKTGLSKYGVDVPYLNIRRNPEDGDTITVTVDQLHTLNVILHLITFRL
jgi:hypothetical protein